MRARLDLHDQHVPRPAVLNGGAEVPVALGPVLHLVEEGAEVEPGNFVQQLLHNCRLGPGLRKSAHVLEIPRREALDLGEGGLEIKSQAVDDFCPPALVPLPLQNVTPELPVEREQLLVHRQCRALLRGVNTRFHIRKPFTVAGRLALEPSGRWFLDVARHSIASSSSRSFAISASRVRNFAMIFFGGSNCTSSCLVSL